MFDSRHWGTHYQGSPVYHSVQNSQERVSEAGCNELLGQQGASKWENHRFEWETVLFFNFLTQNYEENINTLKSSLHIAECSAFMYFKELDESKCLNNKLLLGDKWCRWCRNPVMRKFKLCFNLRWNKQRLKMNIWCWRFRDCDKIRKSWWKKNEAMNTTTTQLQSYRRDWTYKGRIEEVSGETSELTKWEPQC